MPSTNLNTTHVIDFSPVESALSGMFWQLGKWMLLMAGIMLIVGMIAGLFTYENGKRKNGFVPRSLFEHFMEGFLSLGTALSHFLIRRYLSNKRPQTKEGHRPAVVKRTDAVPAPSIGHGSRDESLWEKILWHAGVPLLVTVGGGLILYYIFGVGRY